MGTLIHAVGHGLIADDTIMLGNLVGGEGLSENQLYYVLAAGLTADDFAVSLTSGGAAVAYTTDITDGTVVRSDTYEVVSDGVMDPPTTPSAPTGPSVAGASVSGLVRLHIVLDSYTDSASRIRLTEVQVTHRYNDETAIAGTITGNSTTDFITKTTHGFSGGETFRFKTLTGGTGINLEQTYYVLATGLTADTFQFSESSGGAAVDFTSDVTDGTIASVITPVPDWDYALTLNFPVSATDMAIPALPNTGYAVRARVQDVYGNYSTWAADVELTTDAGNDSLYASLTEIANAVQDGSITNESIASAADIVGSKIKAGTITADLLASTMVLSSLFTTGLSGARVEWDEFGIRMYDASENLVVNLDTSTGDASFTGDVTSANLISNATATFYGATTFPGDSTVVLANGVEAPSNAPTLAASLDYLALTSSPSDVSTARGIAYGTNSVGTAGYWIAADPTQSGGYVAHHYNTSGVYTESIAATGSTATYTTTNGSTSHVSDSAQARASADVQVATPLVAHATRANQKITKVSFYAAGYSGGTPTVRGCVWNSSNTQLGYTSTTTLTAKTFANGNSYQSNLTMTSPLSITAGATYRVGWFQSSSEGIQWDRDDGSGKTQYRGDGNNGNLSIVETLTSSKPNVYYTYTYDVDTRLETAPNIGIAVDGTYIYTLDNTGKVWSYDRATLAYVSYTDISAQLSGGVTLAGLFYDATQSRLIALTASGTGAAVHVKFVRCTLSSGVVTYSDSWEATGDSITGSSSTFHGAARVDDALTSSHPTWWVSISGTVYAYDINSGTGAALTSDRDFGSTTYNNTGLTHDGTYFRGYSGAAQPTRIHQFTGWDWTTASAVYWVGYAWYDSAGTTHETALGPRASITMARRQRLSVTNAAIPTGGADDPDNVRVYMKPNATEPAAGAYWLQATGTGTQRYLTDYTGSGTADGAGTAFPAGTPATIGDSGGNWSLTGAGKVIVNGNRISSGTAMPTGPSSGDRCWRTDLGMEFFYNGTRWLSTTLFSITIPPYSTSVLAAVTATLSNAWRCSGPSLMGGSDIWLETFALGYNLVAGTGPNSTNKWTFDCAVYPVGGNAMTIVIDSGEEGAWTEKETAVDALLGDGRSLWTVNITKTGSPGNIYPHSPVVYYRIVAT